MYQVLKMERLQGSAAAVLLLGLVFAPATSQAQTTLKAAAAKANLYFGAAVGGTFYSSTTGSYATTLKNEFNMAVCENEMKFGSIQARQGTFTYTRPDQLVKFAEENAITMRGHTLVWHSQSGFAGNSGTTSFNRAELLKIMKDHITAVVTHYKGKIHEWDVVNEAIDGSGRRRTDNFWQTALGEDFIDSAFVFAHRADPDAYLYYNDFSSETVSSKSTGIYEMVKTMKAKGIPIHGVGFQTHTGTNVNKASVSENMARLGKLGLRVSITELEIARAGDNATPWNNIMGACLENFNCTSFVTWGINDGQSWLRDGCGGCLIFNDSFAPKPAVYAGLIAAMSGANQTIALKRKNFDLTGDTSGIVAISPKSGSRSQGSLRYAGGAFHAAPDRAGDVRLRVFTSDGTLVSTLSGKAPESGALSLPWSGVPAPGMYLVSMQAGGQDQGVHRVMVGATR